MSIYRIQPPRIEPSPDESRFEHTIAALKGELANIATHVHNAVEIRQTYQNKIQAFSNDLRAKANAGAISWRQAAEEANVARNAIMDAMRSRSTPVAQAVAQSLKMNGKSLNDVIAGKTIKLFGPNTIFNNLSSDQKNKVYEEVTKSAAKSRPSIDQAMRRLRPLGRSLIFMAVAISVYTVATADDKIGAAKKEATTVGAGIAGGIAGGAVAGLMCGPGAPVCVTIGAFVGGALAAFGVSAIW